MKSLLFSTVASAAILVSSASYAQDAQPAAPAALPAAPEAAPTDDGEIIVTAQNRRETVQSVPIAISVLSGTALKDAGVTDFTSLQKIAPSLQVTTDTTSTRVSVRGVGTLSSGEAQDSSIAVNIDGEYINRPTILNAAIFDVERVEVLRGPQGTLYGRNSTGGAVNFIARKPGKEFGINASATYGNYNQIIAEGGVDLPFGDLGGLRVAGIYNDHKGYNVHPNTPISLPQYQSRPGRRSGDDHTWGGRASLVLTPVDRLTINAAVEYTKRDIIPAAQAFVDFNQAGGANAPGANCSRNGFVEVGPRTDPVQCIPQNTQFLNNVDRSRYNMAQTGVGFFKQESTAVRGRVAYDFGLATLSYTGGYRKTTNTGENTLSPAYSFTNYGAPVETNSHELRLNGVTSGITWQAGGFYFHEKLKTDGGLYNPFVNRGPDPLTGRPADTNGAYINYFKREVTSESKSVFGQVEVPLVDRLTAIGGLRYTDDKRRGLYSNYAVFGPVFNSGKVRLTNAAPAAGIANLRASADKVTWLAGLNYKLNRDTLLYAKATTGFKSGGFDGTGTIFQPETNTAYEGGLKLNFGPRSRNIFNLSGFYYDYKNLQNDVLLDPAKGNQTFNAGSARVWGIEAETVLHLSRLDTFNASFTYLSAKYKNFLGSYNVVDLNNGSNNALVPNGTVDLSGNRIPQAPNINLQVGYEHIFDMGDAGDLTARAALLLKGDYYLDFFNYNDSHQKSYTSTDLSIEYKPRSRLFTVQAFVRNIENYRPLTFAGFTSAGPDDIYNWQFGNPRTYGVRVAVDFK